MSGNKQDARTTLRLVAEQLMSIANDGDSQPVNNSVVSASTSATNRTNPVPPSSCAQGQGTVSSHEQRASEHRRVFNYTARRASTFVPVAQQSRASRIKGKNKVHNCTLKFYCLGNVNDDKPPATVARKATLCNCGLGPGTVTVDVQNGSLHECLIEKFPPLSSAGGYELLLFQRGGEQQGFHKLPTPYTPARVKEIAGQAQIYIRPLQKNIELLESQAQVEFVNVEKGPVVECLQCHEEFGMHELQAHQKDVHGRKRKRQSMSDQLHLDKYVTIEPEEPREKKSTESPAVIIDLSIPGPSTQLTDAEQLEQLAEMFPEHKHEHLTDCLALHGSVGRAALSLSRSAIDENDDSDTITDQSFLPMDKNISLECILQQLEQNFDSGKEKLRVDEEDLLNDAMAYYKDSSFNPKSKLRIVYNGQPAADTGGVSRQFYSQLIRTISEEFFHGDSCKSPIYNPDIVASGMMKLVGTIIVHSILQGGPGLPVFSESVYHYLATGDIDAAVQKMSLNDCSVHTKAFISKVAQASDVSTLNNDETTNILSECGLTIALTNQNKMRVIQGIILHDVIGRPKIVLDQLREGFATLGFGEKMAQFPKLFQKLFVPSETTLTGQDIINVIDFPASMNEPKTITHNYLKEFLLQSSLGTLQQFLAFATGATCLPEFGLGRINIKFDDVPSIFGSTCLLNVTFPQTFPDATTFSSSLHAVINHNGKSFNCI